MRTKYFMQCLAHSECFIHGGHRYGAAYYVHITVWSVGTNKKGKKHLVCPQNAYSLDEFTRKVHLQKN